jgi:hypothetical protein
MPTASTMEVRELPEMTTMKTPTRISGKAKNTSQIRMITGRPVYDRSAIGSQSSDAAVGPAGAYSSATGPA